MIKQVYIFKVLARKDIFFRIWILARKLKILTTVLQTKLRTSKNARTFIQISTQGFTFQVNFLVIILLTSVLHSLLSKDAFLHSDL